MEHSGQCSRWRLLLLLAALVAAAWVAVELAAQDDAWAGPRRDDPAATPGHAVPGWARPLPGTASDRARAVTRRPGQGQPAGQQQSPKPVPVDVPDPGPLSSAEPGEDGAANPATADPESVVPAVTPPLGVPTAEPVPEPVRVAHHPAVHCRPARAPTHRHHTPPPPAPASSDPPAPPVRCPAPSPAPTAPGSAATATAPTTALSGHDLAVILTGQATAAAAGEPAARQGDEAAASRSTHLEPGPA